ncbi:MAG: tetratricopeptide repeat protein [Verrucomicrobia bacterium]|nr:tetratricopeptide repeat protein [Kiritimatiellia bacterium]MCP5487905.1 tetratricopeptide repeat protein [Verrucomicrobiota bacterium]
MIDSRYSTPSFICAGVLGSVFMGLLIGCASSPDQGFQGASGMTSLPPAIASDDPVMIGMNQSEVLVDDMRTTLFELGRAIRDIKMESDQLVKALPEEQRPDVQGLNANIVRAASWMRVMKTQSDELKEQQRLTADALMERLEALEQAQIAQMRAASAASTEVEWVEAEEAPVAETPVPEPEAVVEVVVQDRQAENLDSLTESLAEEMGQDEASQAKLVSLIVAGEDLVAKQKYGAAKKKFDQALDVDPLSFRARLGLATCLVAQGAYDRAESLVDVMMTEQKDAHVYGLKGLIDYHQGDLDEAESYLKKAIAEGNRDAQWHNYLGIVLFQKQDVDGAKKALKTAMKMDPVNLDVIYNLIMVTASGEAPDLEEVSRLYDQYLMRGGAESPQINALLRP